MAKYQDDNEAYIFDASQMRSLEVIRLRLYSDAPLSADERRDLANKLDALMHGAGLMSLQ